MRSEAKRLARRGQRMSLVGMAANAALALIKGIAGYLGNSVALVADAIESLADVGTSLVVWFGLKVAQKPPDENHPYGHGKAEPIAGTVVALLLASAGTWIATEAFHTIRYPHPPPKTFTLVVLIVVIVVKEGLFRAVDEVGAKIESTAVRGDALNHRSDMLTSAAAFIGISVAILGGENFWNADGCAALFASCVILFNAWRVLQPAVEELSDAAPPPELEQEVRRISGEVSGVRGIDKCLIRKMGLEYHVDIHVIADGDLSVREGHRIAHKVKDELRARRLRINEVLVHIEPDG